MHTYRVLMKDTVNGESFNFAVMIWASGWEDSTVLASFEFPEAAFISSVRQMETGV